MDNAGRPPFLSPAALSQPRPFAAPPSQLPDASQTATEPKTAPPPADPRRPAGAFASAFSLLLATLWGGNNVSIKTALDYGAPLQIGWMRFVLGAAVTLGYMLVRRETLAVARREIKPILVIGALFSIQLALMNWGQDLTTAGHGVALNSTMPIWTAVMARLFIPSDRLTRWRVAAMALSYAGVLVVALGDEGLNTAGATLLGDALSLISAALLGFRIILISNYAQNVPEGKLMTGQLAIGLALLLAGSYALETPSYTLEPGFWFALAYQGVVIAGFGFLASAWLVKRYLPSTVAFFYFVQPVAGVALAWLILDEEPGRGLLIGAALLCAGALTHGLEAYIKDRRGGAS